MDGAKLAYQQGGSAGLLAYLSSEEIDEDLRIDGDYRDVDLRVGLLADALAGAGTSIGYAGFIREFDEYTRWIDGQHTDPIFAPDAHINPELAFIPGSTITTSSSAIHPSAPEQITHPLDEEVVRPTVSLIDLISEDWDVVYVGFLVGVASTIAKLRTIDLFKKQHGFRTAKTMIASEFYQTLHSIPSTQRMAYVSSILPWLKEMNQSGHALLISDIVNNFDNPGFVSERVYDYECQLKDVMIMYGEKSTARTLAIGNRCSKTLDPVPNPRPKKPSRQKREAILHTEKMMGGNDDDPILVRSIGDIWVLLSSFVNGTTTRQTMLAALLVGRTRSIALHLDNVKRILDVETYNRAIQKNTPIVRCRHQFDKKTRLIEISRIRRDYLRENKHIAEYLRQVPSHQPLPPFTPYQPPPSPDTDVISSISAEKHGMDLLALDLGLVVEAHNDYTRYYKMRVFPLLDEMRIVLDNESSSLTEEIQRIFSDDLGVVMPTIPKLIRRCENKKKSTYDPDRICIKHTVPNGRYREIDQPRLNFSVASTRQAELMKMQTEGMTTKEIVSTAADTLVTIASSRSTSTTELTKLAKLLYTVIDNHQLDTNIA